MKTEPTFLIDANALIALIAQNHEHHARASRWFARAGVVAICPMVEGALVRYLVRIGEHPLTAQQLLTGLHESPKCVFWADTVSYQHLELHQVRGPRQVTDAYLVGLAQQNGARLATFDRGLVLTAAGTAELIE